MKLSCFLLLFFVKMYHMRHVSTPGNGIRISLTKAPSTLQKSTSASMEMKSLYTREKKMISETDILLQSQRGLRYFGPVSIGTPSREFQMLFDTGSSQSWLLSNLCKASTCKINEHKPYDHDLSKTYKRAAESVCRNITYVRGQVAGFCSTDTVSMDGVKLDNAQFLEVTNISGTPKGPYDGLIGLSYDPKRPADNIITQLCKVTKQENKFSIYLNRNTSDANGGEITLCGADESKFTGSLTYVNEIEPLGKWNVRIETVSLQNGKAKEQIVSSSSDAALVDSGASYISGPEASIQAIYKAANAKSIPTLKGALQVDCNVIRELPKIMLKIGQTNYILEGEDYILKVVDDSGGILCLVALTPLRSTGSVKWILGDVFLRKYYSVYDLENHRIGFAESSFTRKNN
ncbi:lysosomal aspartic protease-like [Planococcus citri]|uniref:lysosomal aspartic protease-like n=1 Tax=Planococcus citri TaxID=170843 RepID=UPI0031F8B861